MAKLVARINNDDRVTYEKDFLHFDVDEILNMVITIRTFLPKWKPVETQYGLKWILEINDHEFQSLRMDHPNWARVAVVSSPMDETSAVGVWQDVLVIHRFS